MCLLEGLGFDAVEECDTSLKNVGAGLPSADRVSEASEPHCEPALTVHFQRMKAVPITFCLVGLGSSYSFIAQQEGIKNEHLLKRQQVSAASKGHLTNGFLRGVAI